MSSVKKHNRKSERSAKARAQRAANQRMKKSSTCKPRPAERQLTSPLGRALGQNFDLAVATGLFGGLTAFAEMHGLDVRTLMEDYGKGLRPEVNGFSNNLLNYYIPTSAIGYWDDLFEVGTVIWSSLSVCDGTLLQAAFMQKEEFHAKLRLVSKVIGEEIKVVNSH